MDANAKVVAWMVETDGSKYDFTRSERQARELCTYTGVKIIPLIPLTDHEAALAELRNEKDGVLRQYAENVSAEMEGLLIQLRNAEQRNTTLLSGLEALAGECDSLDRLAAVIRTHGTCAPMALEEIAKRIRTLASAGLEGKENG